jgi:chloride channel, nucleotide-sensitive, 1A
MQLALNDSDMANSEDDYETLEATLIPVEGSRSSTSSVGESGVNGTSATDGETSSPIQDLFSAVSACADLHPDPATPEEGGEDGGMDMTAPGAGGWITSENMHEFIDEDGNFIGGSLPAVAGAVRGRDDDDADEADGAESKWQRTD